MSVFIPILPAVLLALLCIVMGYWNMRKIDQYLAEHPDPADASETPSGVVSKEHLRH